jgi:hypothetical protein
MGGAELSSDQVSALAASLFAWLIFGGGAINAAITAFLG